MEIIIKKVKRIAGFKTIKSPESVVPFAEKPGVKPESKNMLAADDLFSMFTANIIKQKTKFTR